MVWEEKKRAIRIFWKEIAPSSLSQGFSHSQTHRCVAAGEVIFQEIFPWLLLLPGNAHEIQDFTSGQLCDSCPCSLGQESNPPGQAGTRIPLWKKHSCKGNSFPSPPAQHGH